ncbi:hypothetical protein GCM10027047_03300 [Rhodococcus aerolatus]
MLLRRRGDGPGRRGTGRRRVGRGGGGGAQLEAHLVQAGAEGEDLGGQLGDAAGLGAGHGDQPARRDPRPS